MSQHGVPLRFLALASLTALATGCASHSTLVRVPRDAASAPAGTKGVGTAELLSRKGDELQPALEGLSLVVPAHLAQSGDGGLGDRVFRLDPHGFLEGCRWVARGRLCNLATLPDGKTVVGGSLNWFVPAGASATAGAGGWVAQGYTANIASGDHLATDLARVDASARTQFVVGKWLHCRFSRDGPRCLPVEVGGDAAMVAGLTAFALEEGDAARDVIWLGVAEPVVVGLAVGSLGNVMNFREMHRCETSDDSDQVTCKLVTLH